MMKAYQEALRTPGALRFSLAGLFGRLPASMTGLGIVLLIQHSTGSYGLAGLVAAVYILTSAVAAPLQGRIADQFGQRRVLFVVPAIYCLGIAGMVWAAGEPLSLTIISAIIAGTGAPQTGNMVRTRWTHNLKDRKLLSTAFAWEAILDEVVFIIGPVLVTFLTLNVAAPLGLTAAAISSLLGGWGLALQRATAPTPVKSSARGDDKLSLPPLISLILSAIGVGFVFGASEVLIVGFTDELGQKDLAGWVLAVSSVGSLLAGFIVGARSAASDPVKRLRIFTILLACSLIPLPFAATTFQMSIGMFVMGLTIAPTLITAVNLVELVTPLTRLTEALTWVTTGLSAGVALGAVVSGRIVELHSASLGFAAAALAATLAALVAWFAPVSQAIREPKNP
ncbi:MAG: MFS transporter [Actinomycetales bacterium]|nr:MFS transporter [Actinomycetales bacterium]